MNLGHQGNFKHFNFFYKKILHTQKARKAQKAQRHKQVNKRLSSPQMFFMRLKMLPFLFLFACMHFVLFVRVKSSCKKIKMFKIALMISSTMILTNWRKKLVIHNIILTGHKEVHVAYGSQSFCRQSHRYVLTLKI